MSETKTRRPKSAAAKADFDDLSVTRGGKIYPLGGIPRDSRPDLALIGLRVTIARADDADAMYSALERGETPWRTRGGVKTERASKLDAWRDAAAHARAEMVCLEAGIRNVRGEKLTEHPRFLAELTHARRETLGWDKTHLKFAKSAPNVVAWFGKLNPKKAVSVEALFSPTAPPAEPEVLEEAAD
jgi:hypothetical protein